jgi:hypothetical protein
MCNALSHTKFQTLPIASAQSAQATKDSDEIGCRGANKSTQEAAHEALKDMHYMSFTPIDAIEYVSTLLRLNHLAAPNGCSFDLAANTQPLVAGQAIMSLRWDYAIGDGDWYTVKENGDVEAKNPLRYAQSLNNQNYSCVGTRPKGMMFVVESDWKSEMASHRVDDPSIENSGNSLKVIEVDYRKNSDDKNTMVYFYRSKEDALAVARTAKQQVEDDAKADAEQKAADAEWNKKLTSLPYIVANHDVGFKLIYAVCRAAGKDAKGEDKCNDDGTHDWSDDHRVQYHWFSDIQGCEDARYNINAKHPAGLSINAGDFFMSNCVPASNVSGHTLKGYEMVITIWAPGAPSDDVSNGNLREIGSQTAAVFKTFDACYDTIDTTYSKITKDLDVDENGNVLSDKTKSIDLMANCVRVY